MKNLVLTGGGSAGHVTPHLAIIDDLSKNYNLSYIGTCGIEKSIINNANIPFYEISCVKLIRPFSFKNFLIPLKFIQSVNSAKKILKEIEADGVFSKGGYVALPIVFAAKSLKIPVVSHESDLTAGLANKLMSKKCKVVFTSFPETAQKIKNGEYSGAPINPKLFSATKNSAYNYYGLNAQKPTILIFGGGSGSKIINDALRKSLFELTKKYNVLHLCGKNNKINSNIKDYYQIEFEKNMQYAYASSDLVISRAGSNAIFEILALKKPSILIPLSKKASRGDQIDNADYFLKKGLCSVIDEDKLNKDILLTQIQKTINSQNLKNNLGKNDFKSGNNKIISGIIRFIN